MKLNFFLEGSPNLELLILLCFVYSPHFCAIPDFTPLPLEPEARARETLDHLLNSTGGETAADIRSEVQKAMMDHAGGFRAQEGMQQALDKLHELQERYQHVEIQDKGKHFSQELLETWEVGCLLGLAEVTTASALARQESRGAHSREDFPKRDDENWLKHTLVTKRDEGIELKYKPVVVTRYKPKPRVYSVACYMPHPAVTQDDVLRAA